MELSLSVSQPKNILLVDDDEMLREVLALALSDLNVVISEAEDGETAKRLIQSRPFDLVISDIQMPRISGVELLTWAHEELPKLRVILMTGFSEQTWFTESIPQGAVSILRKPFSCDEFTDAVESALSLKRIQ